MNEALSPGSAKRASSTSTDSMRIGSGAAMELNRRTAETIAAALDF